MIYLSINLFQTEPGEHFYFIELSGMWKNLLRDCLID